MSTSLLYLLLVIVGVYLFAKVAKLLIRLVVAAVLAAAFYVLVYPELTALF